MFMLARSGRPCSNYAMRFYCGKLKINDTAMSQIKEEDKILAINNKIKNLLKTIRHQFSSERAAEEFVKYDSGRWFAPIVRKSNGVMTSDGSLLKKFFFPFQEAEAVVSNVYYEGKYGIPYKKTVLSLDEKGKPVVKEEIDHIWINMKGKLSNTQYHSHDAGCREYAGNATYFQIIKDAFTGKISHAEAMPFDAEEIDKDVVIDPFILKESLLNEKFAKAVNDNEFERAKNEISRRSGYDTISVKKVSYSSSLKTNGILYPCYLLMDEGKQPRLMPALDAKNIRIYGRNPVSNTKVMLVTTVVTGAIAFVCPELLPIRVALGASVVAGLYPTIRNKVQTVWGNFRTYLRERYNNTFTGTEDDELRKIATEPNLTARLNAQRKAPRSESPEATANEPDTASIPQLSEIELDCYKVLGLGSDKPITKKDIHEAFNRAIKKVHPDLSRGYDSVEAQKVIEARIVLLAMVKRQKKAEAKK